MKTVKHRVLYVNGQPVKSVPAEDAASADEVFAAIRSREINKALASGAELPKFRDTVRTAIQTGDTCEPGKHTESETDYAPAPKEKAAKEPKETTAAAAPAKSKEK